MTAVLGIAAMTLASCAQAQRASSVAASLDTLMTDLHERGLFNGAIVVGGDDGILYERGFGLANVTEGVPFTPDTPSDGASMGKTLTAAAILMLHEDGQIDLDDSVTKDLPEFPYPEIAVRHLITHSSGLHPDGPYFMFLAPGVDKQTNDRLLEILVEHTPPLAFPTLELLDPNDNRQLYGQGRLYYSARDLYGWVTSFYSNPVLSESALQAGLEPPVLGGEHPSGLNLLNWYYPQTGRRYYFTGDNRYYTFAYWDADRRHAFVFMSNVLMPGWLKPTLAIALIDILEGRRPAPIEAPEYIELSPSISEGMPSREDFASVLGVYDTDPGGGVSIENPPADWLNVGWALDDGWFAPVARLNGGLRYSVYPVDNGMLYHPGFDAWIGFREGADGPAIHWTSVFEGTRTGTRTGN